jgi:hypothetical protein
MVGAVVSAALQSDRQNDVRLKAKWLAQLAEMVCATRQNDVRSWQNGVRAISDVTDVLGKMMCALMCALVCALMCAPVAGVPVAQRISFSPRGSYSIRMISSSAMAVGYR